MRAAIAIGLVLAAGGAAAADPFRDLEKLRGSASLDFEAGYVHAYDRATDTGRVDGLGLAGVRLRGTAGGALLGYRIGLDLHAGATVPGGFAYDVDLYLLGLGLRLGRWSRFGVTGGIGASGTTGTVDDAVQLPVEASLELALGGRIRILARGRLAWVAGADDRRRGTPTMPFGDQLDASVAVRIGHRWMDYDFPTGNGYYLGAAYRESEGARMIGVIIGHSIDVGTK
jgi:hypothetical protein